MKYLLLIFLTLSPLFADLTHIDSFEAEFTQTVTDEKGKKLHYKGHIIASKPQYALWNYTQPIEKKIYISLYRLTIVEPDLEQVITRNISNEFNFFKMLKNAKKLTNNKYETTIEHIKYTITLANNTISSISYTDEFSNDILITFMQQKTNQPIDKDLFIPKYPLDYDIITS